MSEKTSHRVISEGLSDSPSGTKQTPDQERLRLYEFGPFRLDPAERILLRGNEIVPLTPKAFDTLHLLVRNSGHLLEKDELIQKLWPDTFVEEGSLSNNIFLLRKALGEDPPFIETVPRRGYRFVGAVLQLPRPVAQVQELPAGHPELVNTQHTGSHLSLPWVVSIGVLVLALLAIGAALWWRNSPRIADRSQWVQLTKFPDSVTQPALSPDGHMLAFIRGYSDFDGPGQIYVKILPDGQPVQLTHDNVFKMSPVFSPDGSRIAYTTVDAQFGWNTAVVPTLGGEPQPLLRNASGLTWTSPGHVLFSEIKRGINMGVVAAQENRMGARDIYLPPTDPGMAHRSYVSPDGKWVLLVEMDQDHLWMPCHLVSMDGSEKGQYVGPLGGGCVAAAWTPDGKWMYFTSDHGGVPHIWRQRFPDGRPEQVTSGPTEEEFIAMAPDGRSFVTAVAVQNFSLWVHDTKGERQVSLEGNTGDPKFTPDGRKLCYLTVIKTPNRFAWYRNPGELQVADLESGRSEPLVPGFPVLEYDISSDGRLVVMSSTDREGKTGLWVMPFDRSSPPVQIPNIEGASPKFGPANDIFFRHMDGKTAYVYRVHPDGTGVTKAIGAPIFRLLAVSPDGRSILALAPIGVNGPASKQLLPLNGGDPIQIGNLIKVSWPPDGRSILINGYLIPLKPDEALPAIPVGGFHSPDEVGRLPGAQPSEAEAFGPSTGVYAFYKTTVQRNLYRIPIS